MVKSEANRDYNTEEVRRATFSVVISIGGAIIAIRKQKIEKG